MQLSSHPPFRPGSGPAADATFARLRAHAARAGDGLLRWTLLPSPPPPLCESVTKADFYKCWQCDIFPTQMRPLPRPRAGPGEPPPPAFRYELASGRPPGSPEYAGARSRPPLATSDCSLRTSRPTALNPRPRTAGAGHAEGRANVRNTCPTGERVGKRASARWGREEMRGDLSHLLTHRNPASTCWLEKSEKKGALSTWVSSFYVFIRDVDLVERWGMGGSRPPGCRARRPGGAVPPLRPRQCARAGWGGGALCEEGHVCFFVLSSLADGSL